MLVQNHLSNSIGPSTSAMQHQQLTMAAQQQLTALQQQQEQHFAQQQHAYSQGMMPNQNSQQVHNQLHQQAQIRLQQLAQASLARQPAQLATQAQILARAQQAGSQLLQANAMGIPQQLGEPSQQPQMQSGQRIPADKVAQLKQTLQRIATMTDQQREALLQSVSDAI